MKYLLDTNIIIYFLNGSYPEITGHLKHVPAQDIMIPAVVLAELEYGTRNSNDYEKSIAAIRKFTKPFEIAMFSENEAGEYGSIMTDLKKNGTPIGANDMMIAATARANGAVLVTHNLKEFQRVKNLVLEDWTTAAV